MSDTSLRVLRLTRIFDAPPARVFAAWTAPELMMRWFCPRGFTVLSVEIDLRPGGAWRARMRSPEGADYAQHGVYREIVVPERLVFTQTWEPPEGVPGNATLVTVLFAEFGDKTQVTLHQTGFDSDDVRDEHADGWTTSLDALAMLIATT